MNLCDFPDELNNNCLGTGGEGYSLAFTDKIRETRQMASVQITADIAIGKPGWLK